MKYLPRFFVRCSMAVLVPVAANAAGTYYTGNYQSPQQRYNNSPAYSSMRGGYNNSGNQSYSAPRYNAGNNWNNNTNQSARGQNQSSARSGAQSVAAGKESGFYVNAGLGYENAMWQFEMKNAGSILSYDNINWYVFNLDGGYKFNAGKLPMQVMAGLKYGTQGADSKMVDDDVTNGGYWVDDLYDCESTPGQCTLIAAQKGAAVSVGTNSGGSMLGFNLGLGLTDFFKAGSVKFTPSIGYRYHNYKLKTKSNGVLAVEYATAQYVDLDGERRYLPILILNNGVASLNPNGATIAPLRDGSFDQLAAKFTENGSTFSFESINTQGTVYAVQPDISHSYKTTWAGPYVALDMDYLINQNNSVNARVELGLPAYTSTGDQPYRFDWAHPKSVEDKGGFGDAYHLGLGANWTTAITDTVSLSIGMTYDYYSISGADATTYYNAEYWDGLYNDIKNVWTSAASDGYGKTEAEMLDQKTGDPDAIFIKELRDNGWKIKTSSEIESFYKSLGIHVGFKALF